MRVVFVDDEHRVLDGLEMLLFDRSDEWELAFFDNGPDALAELERTPADVIVSDMRMPGMSGEELLTIVSERHPEMIRVVLSGQVETEVAERTLPMVHDFLSKPCGSDVLISTIERAFALARSGRPDALKSIVGRLTGLPSRPRTYSELRRAMSAEDFSLSDLVPILDADMAISASVLHLANAAYFARGNRPVSSLEEAVPRLGADLVSTVALSSQALKGFGGSRVDVERLNAHSREVAVVVANILPQPQSVDLEAAYLHPIGTLVLATALPEDWRAANRTAQQTGMPLEVALEESLGFGAVHAGAYLLRLWNLDPFVPAVVERIREPWKLDGRERVVAGAIWAAHIALHSEAPPAPDPLPDDLADLLARAEDATEAPE